MRNAKLVIFGPKLVQMSELWLWKNGVSVILSDAPQECCSNRMPNQRCSGILKWLGKLGIQIRDYKNVDLRITSLGYRVSVDDSSRAALEEIGSSGQRNRRTY